MLCLRSRRARWRENRTIFNTPNPRLMNVSLLRDSKLLHGQERRGSRMSVRAPSRQPSMASLRPHSPNPSLGKTGLYSINRMARTSSGSYHGVHIFILALIFDMFRYVCVLCRFCVWFVRYFVSKLAAIMNSANQATNQSINQPINQTISQSISQPVNQSVSHPINKQPNISQQRRQTKRFTH